MADYDYDQLYPGRFLKGGLLKGKAVNLTIADVALEEMADKKGKDGKAKKVVLSFRETEMQMIANKTNGECIKGMFGRNTKDWKGKRITLYGQALKAFGKKHSALRILGSPDIAKDMEIELVLGQDREMVTMKKTVSKKTMPAPEPELGADPDTGEVPFDEEEQAEIHELEMGAAP